MKALNKPKIIITPGEPAGIGPELAIQLAQKEWDAQLLFIADPDLLKARAQLLNQSIKIIQWQQDQSLALHQAGTIICNPIALNGPCTAGILQIDNAQYVVDCLSQANHLILHHQFDAVVTGPVHKGVINQAGIPFTGHTEFFAAATHTDEVVMLLATEGLRVALVTTHLALSQVPKAITQSKLSRIIGILHQDLQTKFGIQNPKIRVLGLNPHAGENGYLGDEEMTTIQPVIQKFQQQGFQIEGPVSADTAFGSEHHPVQVDAILAMYHDQGLPVLKYKGFGHGINITLGLPYIRTSVDHGTALDLAGKGLANPSSFEFALQQAIHMSKQSIESKLTLAKGTPQ